METFKYTVIKTKEQYFEYCNKLEELIQQKDNDEIELLELLIAKWDSDNNSFAELSPVELIKTLMESNNLKSKDLVEILGLSKSTVSKILNYQKGLSKETIRKLSDYFKISQEAFNRPYKLVNETNRHFRTVQTQRKKSHFKKVLA
jgi:HTH-type transcriptional regulator/antitoxin HigA